MLYFSSIYSSDDEDEDIEVYDHDYDGLLPKGGKRHLGKTRWTREEVNKDSPKEKGGARILDSVVSWGSQA